MSTLALAAPVDESLVARFEAASTDTEQQKIAIEVLQRLDDGQIVGRLQERVIKVLTSRPALGNSRYTTILKEIGAPEDLSRTSIDAIAMGLVSDGITHDWPAYEIYRNILTAYQHAHGLPDQAFSSLLQALRAERPYWMVIEVLTSVTVDDSRHDAAFSAVVDTLRTHDHYGIRSAAIAGIDQMSDGGQLSEPALSVLQEVALSDDYISTRLEAIALLEKQSLDQSRRAAIGKSLAQELTAPTPGIWQRAPSNLSIRERYIAAVNLLARLYATPYPPHVLNAFIAQSSSFAAERCIELLRASRPAGGFDDEQRRNIELVAAGHHIDAQREALFRLVAPQLNAGSVTDTLQIFEHDRKTSERITAGFALKNHYRVGGVPIEVVEAADRVIRASKDQKLQQIASVLIARGNEDFATREQRLLVALSTHGSYANVYGAFVELYGDDRLDDMLIRYAADEAVPVWFRAQAIRQLGQRATPGLAMSKQAEEALLKAARISSDYTIISAIQSAFTAWHIDTPMIVYLKNKKTHSGALFVLLILCTLVNLLVALIVLFRLLTSPIKKAARAAKRTFMALAWTALSFVVLALSGFAVIGFIGHNSMPDPRDTLQFQVPAYVGTFVYLMIAWFVFRSTRRSNKSKLS